MESVEPLLSGPVNAPDEVRRTIIESIAYVAEITADVVTVSSRFDELGIDSLVFAAIIVEVEDRLNVSLFDEITERLEHSGGLDDVSALFSLLGL